MALRSRRGPGISSRQIEQPGNVNEYSFVWELQFIKGQFRSMAAQVWE
jgi:hypothetical protein